LPRKAFLPRAVPQCEMIHSTELLTWCKQQNMLEHSLN